MEWEFKQHQLSGSKTPLDRSRRKNRPKNTALNCAKHGLTPGLDALLTRRYRSSRYVWRITATFEFSDIRVRWNLDRDLPNSTPRFNVAPETSPNIPVIVRHEGGNVCRLMHWGLIPHWAADPSIGNRAGGTNGLRS
jgi:SOS response associated peptidase (SRAP)